MNRKKIIVGDRTKRAFIKAKTLFFSIFTFIGFISIFLSIPDLYGKILGKDDIAIKIWCLVIVSIAMFIILFLVWYAILTFFNNKFRIKNKKIKIIIYKKNIFNDYFLDIDKILLIPADKDYTINFDEKNKISPKTIQGQFITKFKNISFLNDEFLKELSYSYNNQKLTAFFMPLTEIKGPDYVADVGSIKNFFDICFKTFEGIEGKYNGREIIMPLIGGGLSRIHTKADFFNDINNLLHFWIMLIQIFAKSKITVNICIHPDQWHLINFSKI